MADRRDCEWPSPLSESQSCPQLLLLAGANLTAATLCSSVATARRAYHSANSCQYSAFYLFQCGMKLGCGNFVPPGVDTACQRLNQHRRFIQLFSTKLQLDRAVNVRWDSTPCVANCAESWIKEESVCCYCYLLLASSWVCGF